MMATQPYPTPLPSDNSGSRNIYRINTSNPTPSPGPHSAGGGGFYYPPQQQQQQHYFNQYHPDVSAYGLVTPPASTVPQFGSPLVPQAHYGSVSSQWSMTGLVSPISDGNVPPSGYYAPSPMLGTDPHCAAPVEVFTGHHPRDPMPMDALGFAPVHPQQMYGIPGMPGKHILIGPDGQPAQPEVKKRSRTAQACERCRIRKARVSGGAASRPIGVLTTSALVATRAIGARSGASFASSRRPSANGVRTSPACLGTRSRRQRRPRHQR